MLKPIMHSQTPVFVMIQDLRFHNQIELISLLGVDRHLACKSHRRHAAIEISPTTPLFK